MAIENGKEVSFHYTLKVNKEVMDTSQERGPLTYVHGQGQIIPGLSKALEGLNPGDKKSVTLEPTDAYGEVNPKAYQELPKSQLPKEVEPKIGMNLQATTPDGKQQLIKISEVKDDSIVVDLNHPLAGKTLNFDIEVVSVK